MDFKIFSFSLSCILSRTYVCNVCAYTHTKFAAAKVRKNFHICKYMSGKVRNLLILQGKWEVLVNLREFYCGDIAIDRISIRGLLSN